MSQIKSLIKLMVILREIRDVLIADALIPEMLRFASHYNGAASEFCHLTANSKWADACRLGSQVSWFFLLALWLQADRIRVMMGFAHLVCLHCDYLSYSCIHRQPH